MSDELSFGLGAQVEYITANLTSRAPGSGALAANITAEDIGYGFTAGLLFQPSDQTSIGLGFRSSISHSLSGPSTIMFKTLPFAGIATANIDTPEIVTLGLRQKLSDQFTMLGGVEWTNWSRFQNLSVQVSSPATTTTTVENWKSGWDFSLGGEYAASDNLLLRAGVAYEISPVPDATRTPRIPDNDRLWASVGASYKLNDKMTANLAYSHVFMKDGTTALTGAPLPLFSTFQQNLDIVSAGLTIDW